MRFTLGVAVKKLAAVLTIVFFMSASVMASDDQVRINALPKIAEKILSGKLDDALKIVDGLDLILEGESFNSTDKNAASENEIRKELLKYLVHLFYYKYGAKKDASLDKVLEINEITKKLGLPPNSCNTCSTDKSALPTLEVEMTSEELADALRNQYEELSPIRNFWRYAGIKRLSKKTIQELLADTNTRMANYFNLGLLLSATDLKRDSVALFDAKATSLDLEKLKIDEFTLSQIFTAIGLRENIVADKKVDYDLIKLNRDKLLDKRVKYANRKTYFSGIDIPEPQITNKKAKPGGNNFDIFKLLAKKNKVNLKDLNLQAQSFNFIEIPAGEFLMGSPEDEKLRKSNERQHLVKITEPFQIQATTVTQLQYLLVMEESPSKFKKDGVEVTVNGNKIKLNPSRPVENVSYEDALKFIEKLNKLDQIYQYSLPTEAQWEYAARAGTTTRFFWGESDKQEVMGQYSWYTDNSNDQTHDVAKLKPNSFGLYDVSGNVWQWVSDWYAEDYGGTISCEDPKGPLLGSFRVLRGGSWYDLAPDAGSSYRLHYSSEVRVPFYGFRLVRTKRNP